MNVECVFNDSHINIVEKVIQVVVVFGLLASFCKAMCKTRDNVNSMYHNIWIKETKHCNLFFWFDEAQLWKSTSFPPRMTITSCIEDISSNPKEIHLLYLVWMCIGTRVSYICMKDADYSCIPVRVPVLIIWILTWKKHDVRMGLYVDRILVTLHVVCRVIDAQNLMLIYWSLDYDYMVSFHHCEFLFIAVIFEP